MMKSNIAIAGKNSEQKAKGHEGKTNEGKEPGPVANEPKEKEKPSSSSPPAPQKIKGKCDICGKKDGKMGYNLQKCCMCGVLVHESCYGLVQTNKKLRKWKCAACAAVGTEILISHAGEKRQTMVQEKRPTECVLCSIDSDIHAMHPLYDDGGSNGRHMVLPPQRNGNLGRRLAWVHSLCAFCIGSAEGTKGCVYSCDKDGYFDGAEEEESDEEAELQDDDDSSSTSEEGDNSSGNKTSAKKSSGAERGAECNHNGSDESDSEDLVTSSHHHFAIAGKENGRHTAWSRIIEDLRHSCKCDVCGLSDKNSLRIPVQCVAGDEHEYSQFKNQHPSLGPGEYCHQAMHIGCARWGLDDEGNPPSEERVYCHFGSIHGGPHAEPVVCAFCTLHARDVAPTKKKDKKGEKPDRSSKSSKAGVGKNMVHSNRRKSDERIDPLELKRRRSNEKKAPVVDARRESSESVAPGAIRRRQSDEDVSHTIKRRRSEEAVPVSRSKRQRSSDTIEQFSRVAMPSDDSVPRYLSDGSNKAHHKKDRGHDWVKEASNDLLKQIKSARAEGREVFQDITSSCKVDWKKRLNLPKDEFKAFWKKVKDVVSNHEEPEPVASKVDAHHQVEGQKAAKGGNQEENHASAHLDKSLRSRKSHPNPWSHLWFPSRSLQEFDFGDWDAFEIICDEL